MNQLVETYLEQKRLSWNELTFRTESARLRAIADKINGKVTDLFDYLHSTKKPYTFVSMWNRVVEIWDLFDRTNNPYRQFKLANQRLFKNYYSRKELGITFKEAVALIKSMDDKEAQAKAMDLIRTGLRYGESQTEDNGYVLGKGGKIRKVFRSTPKAEYTKAYYTFYRKLKEVGLTPHMLRKLCATELASKDFKEADLLKVFGWNSIQTAQYYLQPKQDKEILSVMGALV
jgi:integrase